MNLAHLAALNCSHGQVELVVAHNLGVCLLRVFQLDRFQRVPAYIKANYR